MNPTIKDVAKRAGVSVSTVSLVINQKKNVSKETVKKVQQAIDELNYFPRRSAQGLASKKSGNIGFILTDDHFSHAEPFYTKIFLGSEFEARKHNYYILLTTVEQKFSKKSIPRFLLEKNVDGVILAGKVPTGLIEYIRQYDLPVIFIDYLPQKGKATAILIDNVDGASQAVQYLIELGHKMIGFIGGDIRHPSISDRFLGFQNALQNADIPIENKIISTNESYTGIDNGYNAMKNILTRDGKPTALFCSNDTMGIGAMKYLKEQGYKIPEDVSLVGFDDIEAAYQAEPPLTTMKVFKEEIGGLAVEELVKLIEDNKKLPEKKLVPVEIIIRTSCSKLS